MCLFFAGRLLRGNRSTKISSDGLIAFASPNYPPLASAGIDIKYDTAALEASCCLRGRFQLYSSQTSSYRRFEILSRNPVQPLRIYNDRISQGIVLETFGAGNIPSCDNDLPAIISKAFRNGSIVVVCSQCPQGTVKLGTYATSSPSETPAQ